MKKVSYQSAVGNLMYAIVCTRPDIAYAIGVVSRFMSNLGEAHWVAVKWICIYLRGTSKMFLCFGNGDPILQGYTDADYAGDRNSRKFPLGYLVTFAGGAVSWQSRLQKCISLSKTEAEYIAAAEACKEVFRMKIFLHELGHKQAKYNMYCDNQSAIHLAKNSSLHCRTKHVKVGVPLDSISYQFQVATTREDPYRPKWCGYDDQNSS